MESVLTNSVTVENSLRDLIGLRVTKTIAKSKKRTVFREGVVIKFIAEDATWIAQDDTTGQLFEVSFDDFIMNIIFVHDD